MSWDTADAVGALAYIYKDNPTTRQQDWEFVIMAKGMKQDHEEGLDGVRKCLDKIPLNGAQVYELPEGFPGSEFEIISRWRTILGLVTLCYTCMARLKGI